jgi:poly-gamma-glutamate synthesis protein (capsule biosynthesis protein)
MTPMQLRHFREHRASERDAEWLRGVLSREGRELGTAVERDADGTLRLRAT